MGPSKGFGWFALTEESMEKEWSKQWILIYPLLHSFNLAGAWKLWKSLLAVAGPTVKTAIFASLVKLIHSYSFSKLLLDMVVPP